MYRHVSLAVKWSSKLLPTSPVPNPLFVFGKFSKSIHLHPINSVQSPSIVVSSSFSASKFHRSLQPFLAISSSSDGDRVDHRALLRNSSSSTSTFSRSFCSGASDSEEEDGVGYEEYNSEEEDGVAYEEYGPLENMPQLDAVVRVSSTTAGVDISCPWWRSGNNYSSSHGTGLILKGRRVLTSAHAVDHHTKIEVEKYNDRTTPSYTATVLAIAPECDLAILTVNDDDFWNKVKPVEFGDMPSPGDKLIIDHASVDANGGWHYGCLVTARVLRLGMTRYLFWGTKLLAFQINAGRKMRYKHYGPAFDERGKCVGLKLYAFCSKTDRHDFMPAEVMKHFIQDYDKNGAYTGLPLLGIRWQKMENPYLRMLMMMGHDEQGVLITEVKPNYPEYRILKPNDVILSIDGIQISNDGTVPFLDRWRIEFSYLIGKKYVGDKIFIKVRRGAEICEFSTELATNKHFVPANVIGRPLRYYIIGGFVFITLTFQHMGNMDFTYDENELPDEDEFLLQAVYDEPVILCEVLEDEINAECKWDFLLFETRNQVLVAFNGKPVEGLNSLVSMVETCNEDFMRFTFRNHKTFVLPTNAARSRTAEILKAHSQSCAMSDDLKELVKSIGGQESPICA